MTEQATPASRPARADTIIVGSGNSGGIIASRLSEDPHHHVLLLESGPFYKSVADMPAHLLDPFHPQLSGHDWGMEAFMIEPPELRAPTPYPRGHLVGGSSAVNATMAQRGTPGDYDAWAALGLPSWGWRDVLPYFRRLENDEDYADRPYHGGSGPLPIMRVPRSLWPRAFRAFEESARNRGFPACPDFNAPDATGVGPTPRNQRSGLRYSSLVAYLHGAQHRPNLEIREHTRVRRVIFDGTRAVGVEVASHGQVEVIRGSQIVLAAGVFNTPHILMLSGVGPARHLRHRGIDVIVDAPGVGENLIDHCYVPIVATGSETDPQCGLLVALYYSSSDRFRNDMVIIPSMFEVASVNFPVPGDAKVVLVLAPVLGKPRSKGWLRLRSADPADLIEIHSNFLAEPEDAERMKALIRTAYDMLMTKPLSDELPTVLFPSADVVADDRLLLSYMRESVGTGYHGVGTCRMGPESDPDAVVDERLAVRGTESLFVADASVMPDIPAGVTSATCFMIGEKAADLLTRVHV
jgi:choline dehydrogenase